jgi:hypothetical protein
MTLRTWVGRSLFGHVVFFELVLSLPWVIWFLGSNYAEGTLTVSFILQFIAEAAVAGAAVAFAIWHTVTLPLIRRVKK